MEKKNCAWNLVDILVWSNQTFKNKFGGSSHYINPPGMESQKMAGVKISFFKLKSDINTLV